MILSAIAATGSDLYARFTSMEAKPTPDTPATESLRELFEAMRERNAPRRAEVLRCVASLREIAARLRAAQR